VYGNSFFLLFSGERVSLEDFGIVAGEDDVFYIYIYILYIYIFYIIYIIFVSLALAADKRRAGAVGSCS
jgi:hypothetical protein